MNTKLTKTKTISLMNFIYSCMGDNTPSNREWLEKIGYKPDEAIESYEFDLLIVNHEVVDDGYYSGIDKWYIAEYKRLYNNTINCIGNPALFRAVTAIRNDSDYMQYYTDGANWDIWEESEFDFGVWLKQYGTMCWKATLAELQEHFKVKLIK